MERLYPVGAVELGDVTPAALRNMSLTARLRRVVGVDVIERTLKVIEVRSHWHIDSMTHPSIEKRIARIRKYNK